MTAKLRKQLGDELKSRLPNRKYQIVTNVGTVERLVKPLIQLELSGFGPGPSAKAAPLAEMTVHVATHLDGVNAAAEDKADELAAEVFSALRSIPWANPTRATKVTYHGKHLAYEITTELVTKWST